MSQSGCFLALSILCHRVCHIAVGTPGRLCQLIQAGSLRTEDIAMFVLDEADALLGESLYADVTWVYDLLPRRKQVRGRQAMLPYSTGWVGCAGCKQGMQAGCMWEMLEGSTYSCRYSYPSGSA
eukprot:1148386-Pelagomonas_calceolata.AAC.5